MTTPSFWDEIFCVVHGWASHVVIHEAAHAVFAVNHGIPIREVRIEPPAGFLGLVDGKRIVAGGVTIEGDPSVWIPARGETALDFLVIGRVAEIGFFQHALPNSDAGDLALWKSATGWEATTEQIDASRERMRLEVEASENAILALAHEFRRSLNVNEGGSYTGFDEALIIAGADVVRIVELAQTPRADGRLK